MEGFDFLASGPVCFSFPSFPPRATQHSTFKTTSSISIQLFGLLDPISFIRQTTLFIKGCVYTDRQTYIPSKYSQRLPWLDCLACYRYRTHPSTYPSRSIDANSCFPVQTGGPQLQEGRAKMKKKVWKDGAASGPNRSRCLHHPCAIHPYMWTWMIWLNEETEPDNWFSRTVRK